MNARSIARELAVLAMTQFTNSEDMANVSMEQLIEQGLRVLVSETEAEVQVAAASLAQAENAWEDAWELIGTGAPLPEAKREALEEHMVKAFSAAQIAINLTGQAFQVPLIRTLAETEPVRVFALDHLRLYRDHHDEIDSMINEASKNWSVERQALVDRNVLRSSLTELLYQADVPLEVAINEAVELAKKYGSEDSPRFVNGVLGGLVPRIEQRRAAARKA